MQPACATVRLTRPSCGVMNVFPGRSRRCSEIARLGGFRTRSTSSYPENLKAFHQHFRGMARRFAFLDDGAVDRKCQCIIMGSMDFRTKLWTLWARVFGLPRRAASCGSFAASHRYIRRALRLARAQGSLRLPGATGAPFDTGSATQLGRPSLSTPDPDRLSDTGSSLAAQLPVHLQARSRAQRLGSRGWSAYWHASFHRLEARRA